MLLCFDCSIQRAHERDIVDKTNRNVMVDIKNKIIEKRGNICEQCGTFGRLIAHHKIKLMDGGTHDESNIKLLCTECHNNIHKNGTKN